MTLILHFVLASLLGGIIGALAATLYFRPRLARAQKESWAQANIYYTRRASSTSHSALPTRH